MNKVEREEIEKAISSLEYEIKFGERSFWYEDAITVSESGIQEALEILKGITKTKGDKHERT